MARRATKMAEAAADVDAVEAMIGAPHAGKPPVFEGIIAWIAAIAGIVILMFAATLVCKVAETGDSDFSPEGALSREAPSGDDFYREGDPNDGRMGGGRESPFPDAEQEDPVILEVACPPGTVHIATGSDASDSLCIVGKLAGAGAEPTPTTQAPAAAPTVGIRPDGTTLDATPCTPGAAFSPFYGNCVFPDGTDDRGVQPSALPDTGQGIDQSTIGATLVPYGLHCEEDELIGFTPVDPVPPDGYPLGCVHIDTLTGEQ